jgi:hypothetical protein
MTAPTTVPPAALARAEEIVTKFAHGRIKTTGLYYAFFERCCLSLPPDIDDAFTNAYNAHREWDRARVGDTHWMTPADRRALLDKALRELVAALDAAATTRTGEAA